MHSIGTDHWRIQGDRNYQLILPNLCLHPHGPYDVSHGQNRYVTIEIINNTRGVIEGKIEEHDDWLANSSPRCSLIHDVPDKKSRFTWVFPLFKLFFVVRILKISFQIVYDNKND